jgi:hypothetical protein
MVDVEMLATGSTYYQTRVFEDHDASRNTLLLLLVRRVCDSMGMTLLRHQYCASAYVDPG